MGRGRDPRPQQQPGGGQYGNRPGVPPYPGTAPGGAPQGGNQPWGRTGSPDEPQYYGQPGANAGGGHQDDDPGHTRAFTIGEGPDGYDPQGYGGQGHPQGGGYGVPDYGQGTGGHPDGRVSTYRAGRPPAPPAGPRLHWKQLLSGIVLHPQQTFWQMRDYQVWAPAFVVTFVYGIFLAVFGFEETREQLLDASMSTSIPQVLVGGVAVVIGMVMLGAVTNALARQFGGNGAWAPTIGLSMLITSITDAPRVLFAAFLQVDHGLVQIIAWVTWALGAVLLTSMVSRSHDVPWPKALGACSIQVIALFALYVLPTFGG